MPAEHRVDFIGIGHLGQEHAGREGGKEKQRRRGNGQGGHQVADPARLVVAARRVVALHIGPFGGVGQREDDSEREQPRPRVGAGGDPRRGRGFHDCAKPTRGTPGQRRQHQHRHAHDDELDGVGDEHCPQSAEQGVAQHNDPAHGDRPDDARVALKPHTYRDHGADDEQFERVVEDNQRNAEPTEALAQHGAEAGLEVFHRAGGGGAAPARCEKPGAQQASRH